ncbi:PAS-domain containing protein, partial [Aeromonas veronii]|uniref:PAS-domain containing protein n=1 Tax=Aeromonas veronii TaxID=654 RepID=UPI00406CF2D7
AAGRLVICNRRYREMYHLTEDDTRSGCSFYDVLRFRRERGAFTGNIDEIHARVMRNVATGRPGHAILESGDGRVFQALYNPLLQGGWITTV